MALTMDELQTWKQDLDAEAGELDAQYRELKVRRAELETRRNEWALEWQSEPRRLERAMAHATTMTEAMDTASAQVDAPVASADAGGLS